MTHVLKTREDSNGVLEALSFNFPVFFVAYSMNLLGDVENTLSIMRCNSVEHIQAIHSNVDPWVAQPDQCIVKKHVKPLLVERLFVRNQECVTRIHDLVIFQELLQRLNYFNSHLKIMLTVAINQLTNVLSFWC